MVNLNQHLEDSRRDTIITASQAWGAVYERQKLWREKTFRADPFMGNEATQWGNDHEQTALGVLEDVLNMPVQSGNVLHVHPTLPLGASPDGFLEEANAVIEIKCPFSLKVYETIPERYYFQMQIQMLCCNKKQCLFFVWTPEEYRLSHVEYDQDFIDWYIPYAEEFIGYVRDDKEPVRWKKKPIFNISDERKFT